MVMRTVEWVNNRVKMIDQRLLPWELLYQEYETYQEVADAIRDMVIRGAPAIGAAAGFGMALAVQQGKTKDLPTLRNELALAAEVLKASRPTAVNLAWAVEKLLTLSYDPQLTTVEEIRDAVLKAAQKIADDDVETNKILGAHGSQLIKNGDTILHHCNTGSLATVDYGTALGVIRAAHEDGKKFHVLLDETRPRLQGARLSAWELQQLGISYDIIPDTAAGYYMQKGEIKLAVVGADRIAANGDVANKIGTYQIAVLAKENWLPFYVAAPTSTVDLKTAKGADIPIEERDGDEVRCPYGLRIVPEDWPVRNPAFDVTPAQYITGIITEYGLVKPPYLDNLKKVVKA
ncbi:MAG: S-methyl-5-thioribose-1-phosphate isomerase [Anaerolineae bacterium]|nr:S-methyl-5-thioribose-1-phosphate isomerase [Anaerolineae bacterium]